MVLVVGGERTGGAGHLFAQQIGRELPQYHADRVALFGTEHERVGKHLPVAVFVAPQHVNDFHVAHAGYLESLVEAGAGLVAAHVHIVVHEGEGLYYAVGHSLAVGRRVVAYLDHLLELDGFVEPVYIVGELLVGGDVGEYAQVVELVELVAYALGEGIVVVGAADEPSQQHSLLLGEVYALVEFAEEWRVAVEPVVGARLDEPETGIAEEVEVVIQIAQRDAHTVAELCGGVVLVLGHQ